VTANNYGCECQSTELTRRVFTQDEIASILLSQGLRNNNGGKDKNDVTQTAGDVTLPEGITARTYIADLYRRQLAEENRRSMDDAADCELGDSVIYSVYPNFQLWGGFMPNWVYRFRPVGIRHDDSVMEIFILRDIPEGEDRPAPAPFRMLTDEEPWGSAAELGGLGPIIDQNWANLEQVQLGLQASATGLVQLGHYLELKIRHHHQLLARYLRS
jgi:hypothetical protein